MWSGFTACIHPCMLHTLSVQVVTDNSGKLTCDEVHKVMYVKAVMPGHDQTPAGACAVNLLSGLPVNLAVSMPSTSGPDYSLHFNPRFYLNYVVRNTYTQGRWGPEETGGGMPLVPSTEFKLAITMRQDGYEISVNGEHFTQYKYRIPQDRSLTLMVTGIRNISNIAAY